MNDDTMTVRDKHRKARMMMRVRFFQADARGPLIPKLEKKKLSVPTETSFTGLTLNGPTPAN